MAALNASQTAYAMRRITIIENERLEAAKAACTKPGTKVPDAEKLDAIRDMSVDLLNTANLSTRIRDAFDFSNLETKSEFDSAKFKRYEKQLKDRANKIRDNLMLGDAAEALKSIQEFETFKLV